MSRLILCQEDWEKDNRYLKKKKKEELNGKQDVSIIILHNQFENSTQRNVSEIITENMHISSSDTA